MSWDGFDEQAYILGPNGLGSLAGGRVWEVQVPPKVKLKEEGGEIQPYLIVNFGSPVAFTPGGRSDKTFASTEKDQSHLMAIQVYVHASSVETLRSLTRATLQKLVGMTPNRNGRGNEISAQGGPVIPQTDSDGKVIRLIRVIHAQLVVS